MIPKETKYDLHYDDVRGEVLPPPHDSLYILVAYFNRDYIIRYW